MKKLGGITAIALSLCAAVAVIFLIIQRTHEGSSGASAGAAGDTETELFPATEPVFEQPVLASDKFKEAQEEEKMEEKEPLAEGSTEEDISGASADVVSGSEAKETGSEETNSEEETEIPDGETPQPADQYMLCIDPGHFGGANQVTGNGSYGYAEGDVTLQLAARLQEILWDTYGVDSYLTRESEHITLNGLTDKALDSRSIYLRGAYASLYQCDLFISLHTNANAANANGYPQFDQPEAINKPMVILNETALDSELAKKTALAVGKNLAEVYRTHNLHGSDFDESTFENVPEWTGTYNDGLGFPGKIVRRTGQPKEGSNDYYGVLRGSANEDIPGMIIEHGYHSVKEIRRLAIEGNLIEEWAKADARGIAEGLGLEPLPS